MKVSEIIDLTRAVLDDAVVPYRWSLVELLAYLNQTVNEFCERTRILVDSTTVAICRLTLVAGTARYATDPRIIEILSPARLLTGDCKVTRRTRSFMEHYYPGWNAASAGRGTPQNFMTDLDSGYLTLYPTPETVDTLSLTVVRYPLAQVTATNLDQELPEIPFVYHYDLPGGIGALAYLKQDSETYDPQKAARLKALFLARCQEVALKIINENDIDNLDEQVPDYLDQEN